jgi:hypothetical protein
MTARAFDFDGHKNAPAIAEAFLFGRVRRITRP